MTTTADRRPTIRDVAEMAGVSKSLVSLVMRGSTSVSDARRDRVLQAARTLGYNTNWAARSLKEGPRPSLIGFLIRDLHQPWASDLVDGARPVLEAAGYRVLLSLLSAAGRQYQRPDLAILEVFRDLRVAGTLAIGSVPEAEEFTQILSNESVVFAGWGPTEGQFDVVRSDDTAGMTMIVEHLVDRGHRRIAHVGGHGGVVGQDRQAAYEAAMRRYGLDDQIRVRGADFSMEAGYQAARELLDTPTDLRPTALACSNDLAALGAMRAADELNIRTAITGYDNIDLAAVPRVGLTTIDPHSNRMGVQAARALLDRLSGHRTQPIYEAVAPQLVVRSSTNWY